MKKLLPLTFLGALLVGAFTVPAGCGDPCVNSCEDAKDCEGVPDEIKNLDCQDLCDAAKQAAEDAGCGSEYDDANSSCTGGSCTEPDTSSSCVDAQTAYSTCLSGGAA